MSSANEDRILRYAEEYSEDIENVRDKKWLLIALTSYVCHDLRLDKREVREVLRDKFFN